MNYRVVLADDEPEVLRSIQRTLDWEKYGFSVVGAFLNGLDVLEFLENHDVDIRVYRYPDALYGRNRTDA